MSQITLSQNGYVVDNYDSHYEGMNIIIAIDSSKSNTAIIVGDTTGRVLDDYEISGAGEDINVYDLGKYTRVQLRRLFDGANILYVGIEDIITKKENGYNGLSIHKSRYKITHVFDSIIIMFQDYFNIMPHLINNNTWKVSTLPAEYRTRSHKKGSKDFLMDIGSEFGHRKDDVCDAYCIYGYILSANNFKTIESIKLTRPTQKKYAYVIYPEDVDIPGSKWFDVYNNDSLQMNVETVAENIDNDTIGLFKWDTNKLSIDDIYSDKLSLFGSSIFGRNDKQVVICVGVTS